MMGEMSLTSQPNAPGSDRELAEARYHDAVECLAHGDPSEAVDGFRSSLEADPTYSDSAHGLIHALRHAHRLDEAVVVAQQLVSDHPDDVLAHTSLSILYQHQGKIPEAEAEATRAKLLDWKKQLRDAKETDSKL